MQRIATGMSLVSLAVGFSILGALIIMKRDYAELNGVADGSSIALIGMLANTCIESTGRFGMELGYHAEGRFDRLIQKIKNKPICLRTQKKSISLPV